MRGHFTVGRAGLGKGHWLFTAAAICAMYTTVARADLIIPGQVALNGTQVVIGSLSASVTNPNSEASTFTLDQQFRNVMSDANGAEFRVFQVITYDDEPTKWNGSIITPAGTANHTGDVVDTPSGGWDYESTTGNKGGDDTSPFYESDTANNPTTGKPYAFPTLSYPSLHSADGVNPGTMSTSDNPGLNNANHQTLFETFIAYENPTLLGNQQIDVLGAYSWGIQTDASNVTTGIAPSYISYNAIDGTVLAELNAALNISGFNTWRVVSTDAILTTLAPEPSSLAIACIAGTACGLWGLVRRRSSPKNAA